MTMRFFYFSVHFRRLGMATGLIYGNHSRSLLSSVMSMGAIKKKKRIAAALFGNLSLL